jgi:uncharacterized protein YlxW (UPF0749 family)
MDSVKNGQIVDVEWKKESGVLKTDTLDMLYLEWSQFTEARTKRELELQRRNQLLAAQVGSLTAEIEQLRATLGAYTGVDDQIAFIARTGPVKE